jgi:hypothetical protein
MANQDLSNLRPGSIEACEAGCSCSMWDNEFGHGYQGISNQFVMIEDCPIHGHIVTEMIKEMLKKAKKKEC